MLKDKKKIRNLIYFKKFIKNLHRIFLITYSIPSSHEINILHLSSSETIFAT